MSKSRLRKKRTIRKALGRKNARSSIAPTRARPVAGGPLTLEQAKALVHAHRQRKARKYALSRRALLMVGGRAFAAESAKWESASLRSIAEKRKTLQLRRQQENRRRIQEYTATLEILKRRGVKGLAPKAARRRAFGIKYEVATRAQPLQILAEGDSWFDYPVPFFGGGIITRLEGLVGVPILNLAKAGDEVRFMMGVEERTILANQLKQGCPAGGPWDVVLFSGGGNDVVDNPMALWVKDFDPAIPASNHINQVRFAAVLALLRGAYEDLITMRDALSPTTHLVFHAYDFAIPDGRGVCGYGPWLKPTFDLRGFPRRKDAFEVVKAMLKEFAALLQSLSRADVTFVNAQGTLSSQTSSWHNELHPSKVGFQKFAEIFHQHLKAKFPGRVL